MRDVRPTHVFNLAAMSHVRISFDVPSFTIKTNASIILSRLISKNISVEIEEFTNIDRNAMIKQKTVDIFLTLNKFICTKYFFYYL